MSRIGRLDRGITLLRRNDRHDSGITLSKMSGVRHIARLRPYRGAACGSGPIAMPKDRSSA